MGGALPSPTGLKRQRSDLNIVEPRRIRQATDAGRPKAQDWEVEVQEVIFSAIQFYRVKLCTINPFPDHLTEIAWAKAAWQDACDTNDIQIAHNSTLLKLVRRLFSSVARLNLF